MAGSKFSASGQSHISIALHKAVSAYEISKCEYHFTSEDMF
jgi:3-dehydroquinate dehydratase